MRSFVASRSFWSWRYSELALRIAIRSETGRARSAAAAFSALDSSSRRRMTSGCLSVNVSCAAARSRRNEAARDCAVSPGVPLSDESSSSAPCSMPWICRSRIESRSCSPRIEVAFVSSCRCSADTICRLALVCSGSRPMYDSFICRSRPSSAASRDALARSWFSMNWEVSCARISRDLLFSSTNTCTSRFVIRCASSAESST